MEINADGVHLLAINFGGRDDRIMTARFQFERNGNVWMHVAERTKCRKDYPFAAH